MIHIAALVIGVIVLAFIWDLIGQPTPASLKHAWRKRRRRRRGV